MKNKLVYQMKLSKRKIF